MLGELFTTLTDLLLSFGYLGIGLIVALEYACFPLASEILLPFIGFFISQGKFEFVESILISILGGVIGSLALYAVGYYGGSPALEYVRRKFPKSNRNITIAIQWFDKYGKISVLLARLLPVARTWISFIAGLARMNVFSFLGHSLVGIIVWNTALITFGYVLGERWQMITKVLKQYSVGFALIILLLGAVFILYWHVGNRRSKSSN